MQPDFLPADLAERLRGTFDANFADPAQRHADRFVWDTWHKPGPWGDSQFNLAVASAEGYFEAKLFGQLESALLDHAKERLGCIGMTPIALSCYTGACLRYL